MADVTRSEYLTAADWDALIQTDPARAVSEAQRVAEDSADPTVAALARGTISRALFDLGRLEEARRAARIAIEASMDEHVPDDVRWSVGLSAAVIIAESGNIEAGLSVLDQLGAESDGVHLGRVKLQRGYVLHHAGRINDALVELDACERLMGADAEARDRVRVHLMRGVVLLQQGRLDAAEADLAEAELLARNTGMLIFEAQSAVNRGVVYGRSRRVNEAVAAFERAESLFEKVGSPARTVAHMEIDRAEVMMLFGLSNDAAAAAAKAVELVAPTGNRMLLGDAQLMLARARLAGRGLRGATEAADAARSTFELSGRAEMVAHAESVAAQARLRSTVAAAAATDLQAARDLVERLYGDGWHEQADSLLVARVRAACRLDRTADVADDLQHLRLGAWSDQRDKALAGWYAEAVARRLDGAPSEALDACRAGLDRLDDIVAEAPTLEQRSAAMRLGDDLSQLAIELAVGMGDADTVLAAAEGTRARALHEGLAATRRHHALTEDGARQFRRELASRLGTRSLVEWVVVQGDVWAVVFDGDGSRLVHVATRRDVVRARDRLLVWLDRAAAEPDGSAQGAARASALLDELLIAPLDLPDDDGVLVVPVDLLHGVPWSGLPSLASRPVTLCPNGQLWLEADRGAATPARSVGLVIGPEVESAEIERDAITGRYSDSALAAGAGATAATVRSMLGAYDLVHLAAHGSFRSDYPLLSTLQLRDGRATLHDSIPERVRSKLVVLSSCEGGAQGVSDGSEVLGLSGVLLARGAASVLAPLTIVRDLECSEFVAEVHAELARGVPVGAAVASVRTRWLTDDDLSRWAVASSFTCFGSGAVTVEVA